MGLFLARLLKLAFKRLRMASSLTANTRGSVWCFTINAKAPAVHPVRPVLEIEGPLLFYKYQLERGEADLRLHYQGCLRFSTAVSMLTVKRILRCDHAHLERAVNWRKTVDYCGKEETRIEGPWQAGEPGQQGKRTDLDAVGELVRDGASLKRIAEDFGKEFIKYSRGISALQTALRVPIRADDLDVICLYGDTGTGKTHTVFDIAPDVYRVFNSTVPWFDGYEGHTDMLFDEYGPGKMQINMFKEYLDKYPIRLPIKGGSVARVCKRIWITTNYLMQEWYPKASLVDLKALERRIRWFSFDDPIIKAKFIADNQPVQQVPVVQSASAAVAAILASPVGVIQASPYARPMILSPVSTQILDSDDDGDDTASISVARTPRP